MHSKLLVFLCFASSVFHRTYGIECCVLVPWLWLWLWLWLSPKTTASLAGGVGGCNHHLHRDEVLGVEWTVVACCPLRPPSPCLKTLYSAPVSDTSAPARREHGAARGAGEAPSWVMPAKSCVCSWHVVRARCPMDRSWGLPTCEHLVGASLPRCSMGRPSARQPCVTVFSADLGHGFARGAGCHASNEVLSSGPQWTRLQPSYMPFTHL